MLRLKNYMAVGWDLDGTLYDHTKSEMFAQFIRENPFKQIFHIVTFRSHGMQYDIDRDLAEYDLDQSFFKRVINLPDHMYEAFDVAIRGTPTKGGDPIWDYHTWKGKVCRDLGAGLLIDDVADHVMPGCAHYNVDYLHPDALEPL